MRGDEGLASQVTDSLPDEVTRYEEHVAFKDGIITIGCVGELELQGKVNGFCATSTTLKMY